MSLLKLFVFTSLACGVASALALWSVNEKELPYQDPIVALKALNLPPKPPVIIPESVRRMVTEEGMTQTLLGFDRQGEPPPWERGNRLSFSMHTDDPTNRLAWIVEVVNMHAENVRAMMDELGTESVEMLLFLNEFTEGPITQGWDGSGQEYWSGFALVVDERIPNEWYLESARDSDSRVMHELLKRYPQYFRVKE